MEGRRPEKAAGEEIRPEDARPEDTGDVPTGPAAPMPDHAIEERLTEREPESDDEGD